MEDSNKLTTIILETGQQNINPIFKTARDLPNGTVFINTEINIIINPLFMKCTDTVVDLNTGMCYSLEYSLRYAKIIPRVTILI